MFNKKIHRHIITLLALGCLSTSVFAQTIELQKNHPDQYTVQKGDTLWGISGKFLKDPWKWPIIWKMNRAEIKNPHWIYPGDVVVLDTSSGTPQLSLLRETVTLQPGVREEPLGSLAIQAISPKIIAPFLSQPLLIENGQLDKSPRIIGNQENRVVLSPGTRVYVNQLDQGQGAHWNIYRPGEQLIDPDTKEVLGTEAIYLGDLNVTQYGAPASGDIVRAKEEIFTKDRLVVSPDEFKTSFIPHAPEKEINGRIISIYGGVAEAGPNSVVTINRGEADGLEPGHVLAIYRYGKVITDPEYKSTDEPKVVEEKPKQKEALEPGQVKLPDERVGLLMLFRTFDRVSYGLIMNETDAIYTFDAVRTP
jgi:hypothetical protein